MSRDRAFRIHTYRRGLRVAYPCLMGNAKAWNRGISDKRPRFFLYMLVYRIYEHFKYKSDEYEKNSNAMRMALRHYVHACASAASD